MSDHDIQAGARWGSELGGELEASNFGILCLTPENLQSHWLTFEAGALSKAIKELRVAPYPFQLRASEVGPPLSQFQGVDANEEGTLKLILSINEALRKPCRPWNTSGSQCLGAFAMVLLRSPDQLTKTLILLSVLLTQTKSARNAHFQSARV